MSDANHLKTTVESLFQGIDKVISSKTVVGDAIQADGITILPLLDVSFGLGAGAGGDGKKDRGMGGVGGKVSPSAVLVIKDGSVRLVNIKNQDIFTKMLDLAPNILDKFTEKKEDKVTEEDVAEALDAAADET